MQAASGLMLLVETSAFMVEQKSPTETIGFPSLDTFVERKIRRMEHSPGPWTIRKSGTGRTAIVAADNLEVAFIFRNQRFGGGNAALIAAAPALAEVLEKVLPSIEDPKLADVAAEAIAKSRRQTVT